MLLSLLRGIWLLRSPLLRRRLGELRVEEERLEELRRRFGTRIDSDVILHGFPHGSFSMEPGSTVSRGTVLAVGDQRNGFGTIAIGAGTWIGEYNNLRASANADILIGSDCLISQFCSLIGANHDLSRDGTMTSKPTVARHGGVRLGNDVWLGAGVTVLPGVTIGDGAVIGANAVVSKSVAPYEIWGGIPARRIGERSAP